MSLFLDSRQCARRWRLLISGLFAHMPKPLMQANFAVRSRSVNVLRVLDANLAAGHASGQVVVDGPANVVV